MTTADGTTHRAGHVVLAADAWTNELLASFGRRLPLTITKEQVTYYACPRPERLRAGSVPGLDLDGRAVLLRLPDLRRARAEGGPGRRRARDAARPSGRSTSTSMPMPGSTAFLRGHLPGALGPDIYTKTCLYTLTPDRDFVLDRVPEAPNVLVALGAAHAFKFASLFGRILAELIVDGATPSAGRHRTASGSTGRSCSRTTRRRASWSELGALGTRDDAWSATLGAAIDRVRRAVPQCGPRGSVGVHRRWIGRASGGGTTNAPDPGGAAHPTRARDRTCPRRPAARGAAGRRDHRRQHPATGHDPGDGSRRIRTRPRSSRATRRSS